MASPEMETTRRPWIGRTGWLLALALGSWFAFHLFKPVVTWSFGWTDLPAAQSAAFAVHDRTADPDWEAIAKRADAVLESARSDLQAPALSAAVMIDRKRVWAAAAGLADVARDRRVDLTSKFRLGSSSKAINALALGRLLDSGLIDIEKPVRHYVADLPESYARVTTRQAISHTAGIPDYGLCFCFPVWEHKNRRHFNSVRDGLRVFEHRPLAFEPGTAFRYSSYGTNVAGAVIEAIANRPYAEFVATAVLQPLGLSNTSADNPEDTDSQAVAFLEVRNGQYKSADAVDNSIRIPSGGMLSTPSDMLAIGNAFLDSGFLSAETRSKLLTPQALADGSLNPQGYALGIRVSKPGAKMLLNDTVKTQIYSHHGTAVGSTSYFAIYPEFGLVASLLMNKGQENLDALVPQADRVVSLFIAELLRRRQEHSTDKTAHNSTTAP